MAGQAGSLLTHSRQQQMENPLFLEDTLDQIFQFLSIKDLQQCISICKFWREIGWKQLIRSKPITFTTDKQIRKYIVLFSHKKNKNRSVFVNDPSFERPKPFLNYVIRWGFDESEEPPSLSSTIICDSRPGRPSISIRLGLVSIEDQFFANFSSDIQFLDVHQSKHVILLPRKRKSFEFVNLRHLSARVDQFAGKPCPSVLENVDHLTLYCGMDHAQWVINILNSCTNLRTLEIRGRYSTYQLVPNLSVQLISYLLVNALELFGRLKCLIYRIQLSHEDVKHLLNLNLQHQTQLRSISLSIWHENSNHEIILKLLEALSRWCPELEELFLELSSCWKPNPDEHPPNFPCIQTLKKLALNGYRGGLEFLASFPSLKELELKKWRPEINCEVIIHAPNNDRPLVVEYELSKLVKCTSVVSLTIIVAGFPRLDIVLDYITSKFPKLTVLRFDANVMPEDKDKYIQYVKEKLPQLNQLRVEKSQDKSYWNSIFSDRELN